MDLESPTVAEELEASRGLVPRLETTQPVAEDVSLLRELELARQIQQSQFPAKIPQLPGLNVAGFSLGARPLQGDFFDVLSVGKGRMLLVVADVMGKGVPGALLAATVRAWVRTLAEYPFEPGALLRRLNRVMHAELDAVDMFVTVQLALADTERGVLTVASAGHCPLLLCDQLGSTRSISPYGVPLGILPEAAYTSLALPLEDISLAVLFTDGLTEATKLSGESFGQQRLVSWLARNAGAGLSAAELCAKFREELLAFQTHAPRQDDQTLLMMVRELV